VCNGEGGRVAEDIDITDGPLEDIYVREWARGRGVGRRLMARLAAIAIERDWPALHFNVLHWNPAPNSTTVLALRHATNGGPMA